MSASCASALSAGAESLEARTRALREELTTTLQAFDGVHTHADAITTGVRAWAAVCVRLCIASAS
eukprot:801969-Pelagomonas_calceolata.AAC.7